VTCRRAPEKLSIVRSADGRERRVTPPNKSRHNRGRSSLRLPIIAAIMAVVPTYGSATSTLSPYATVDYQYNSNVFLRPSDSDPLAANGVTGLSDRVAEFIVGGTEDLSLSQDHLRLTAEAKRYEYDQFEVLDRYEYNFGVGLDWHLGPIVDGTVSYLQSHYMPSLADTLATQLELDTDRTVEAKVRVAIAARWTLELDPRWHELTAPLPEFPEFQLTESSAAVALKYLGISKLVAGVRVEYADGRYSGILQATKYHQTTTSLTAEYAVNGLSSFNARLGYTRRDTNLVAPDSSDGTLGGALGSLSDLSGEVGYHRHLTAKTSVDVRVFRDVDSYIAGANPELRTGGEVGINWDIDAKFTLGLHYSQSKDSIQGDLLIAAAVNRDDRLSRSAADLTYRIRRWLEIRAYASREKRDSNVDLANYTNNIVGINLTARLQ
jgi:hypothetical protein